jgi:hypothetical protein
MKNKILIFLSLLIFASTLQAKEIEGAFGLKFNSHKESEDKKTKKVKFIPEEGFEFLMFQNYYYSTTPKTNKIYSISAEGSIINGCNKDLAFINKIIKDKYDIESNRKEIPVKFEKDGDIIKDSIVTYLFKDNSKQIMLSCDPEEEIIIITYIELETAAKAFKEAEKLTNKELTKEIKKLKEEDKLNTKGL